jgi:hypothetical protein
MLKRILLLLALSSSLLRAADSPPSDASIKQLLEVTHAHKILDATMAQMDGLMKQTMQQATQGRKITPEIQKDIDKRQAEVTAAVKEALDWSKLEPMYTRIYQKSFTQTEIDGLIAFYKTPSGQALIGKMPVVMQNTLTEMQDLMRPMLQRMQQNGRDVAAEIQEKEKKGG